VSYIEKAYAKLNEGYFNICNNGRAKHALTDITSAPTRTFEFNSNKIDAEKLVKLLTLYQSKKYPMTAKTVKNSKAMSSYITEAAEFLKINPGNQDRFMFSEFGLFPDYEYALFGIKTKVIELKGVGKIEHEFVEVRCTHGPGYLWKGPSSYKDEEDEFEFNMPDPQDGNMLVPIDEFLKIFENFSVCFFEDDYLSTAIRAHEVPYSFISYKITVKKRGEYYFRLCQLSHYMIHPESNFTKLEYDNLTLIVSHQDDQGELTYLAGCSQR
jgi:hypothetical protein